MVHHLFYYVVPTVVVLFTIRKYRESRWKKCENTIRLDGKVAIVTGANSGIGYEIAKELCKRGAEVVFACRNRDATYKAIGKIEKDLQAKGKKVYVELDLASIQSVKSFVAHIKTQYRKIDILVNNAGVSFDDKTGIVTKDGYEVHFGVNHLGHFLLTNLLLDCLENAKPSRVIILSSILHQKGKIDFANLNLESPTKAKHLYANSKLANVYFCKELAKIIQGKGVNVYCVCPGWVLTSLFRNHFRRIILHLIFIIPAAFLFLRSPKQGAQTAIFCATDPSVKGESGLIYRDCQKFTSKVQFDDDVSKTLWDVSLKMLKEKDVSLVL